MKRKTLTSATLAGIAFALVVAIGIATAQTRIDVRSANPLAYDITTGTDCDGGSNACIVSGTAGADAECAQWNADGDLVTSGGACGGGGVAGLTSTATETPALLLYDDPDEEIVGFGSQGSTLILGTDVDDIGVGDGDDALLISGNGGFGIDMIVNGNGFLNLGVSSTVNLGQADEVNANGIRTDCSGASTGDIYSNSGVLTLCP